MLINFKDFRCLDDISDANAVQSPLKYLKVIATTADNTRRHKYQSESISLAGWCVSVSASMCVCLCMHVTVFVSVRGVCVFVCM